MIRNLITVVVLVMALSGCQQSDKQGTNNVSNDEIAIQNWFDDWIRASTDGDLELAKSLIADDAVFLVPGAGQMDKASFAAAATASDPNTDFEIDASIDEIRVAGDHAWLVSRLSLTMTDKQSGAKTLMKGDGLSILKRESEKWVVVRDANTMVPVPGESQQSGTP